MTRDSMTTRWLALFLSVLLCGGLADGVAAQEGGAAEDAAGASQDDAEDEHSDSEGPVFDHVPAIYRWIVEDLDRRLTTAGFPKIAERPFVVFDAAPTGDYCAPRQWCGWRASHGPVTDGERLRVLGIDLVERDAARVQTSTLKRWNTDLKAREHFLDTVAMDRVWVRGREPSEEAQPPLFCLAWACYHHGLDQAAVEILRPTVEAWYGYDEEEPLGFSMEYFTKHQVKEAVASIAMYLRRAYIELYSQGEEPRHVAEGLRRAASLLPADSEDRAALVDLRRRIALGSVPPHDGWDGYDVEEQVDLLRGVACVQRGQPGWCNVVELAREQKQFAILDVLTSGRAAVPLLIAALTDTRTTRSYGFHRDFVPASYHVLTMGDVAEQLLWEITGHAVPRDGSEYLSQTGAAEAVKAGYERWWKENRERALTSWFAAATQQEDLVRRSEAIRGLVTQEECPAQFAIDLLLKQPAELRYRLVAGMSQAPATVQVEVLRRWVVSDDPELVAECALRLFEIDTKFDAAKALAHLDSLPNADSDGFDRTLFQRVRLRARMHHEGREGAEFEKMLDQVPVGRRIGVVRRLYKRVDPDIDQLLHRYLAPLGDSKDPVARKARLMVAEVIAYRTGWYEPLENGEVDGESQAWIERLIEVLGRATGR